MAEFQIRDLRRVRAGARPHWTARLVMGKESLNVDSCSGSWQADLTQRGAPVRCDLLPHVAAALQAKVRPLEKRERRELEAVAA